MLEKKSTFQFPVNHPKKKKHVIDWLIFILLTCFLIGGFLFKIYKNDLMGGSQINSAPFSNFKTVQETVSLIPDFLGFNRSQTYLVLFLNNTEIRPGGGFIGSYAVLRINKGKIEILETNGSENLDWSAPKDFKIKPPYPISTYMKQAYWYFRDSNWSPDFSVSAKNALWFYRFEGGGEGSKIDGVIGITPTVVEKMMAISGPLTINGKEFTSDNFTEDLEYHVEYGYKEIGQAVEDRKSIIGDLSRALMSKLSSLPPWRWGEIWAGISDLLEEKQIMIFSNNNSLQNILEKKDWAGIIKKTDSDYLLVTDSNLASLKTDLAVKRKITYTLKPSGDNYLAQVRIEYDHRGKFDWRTTRYRTYTKIYVPQGSTLIKAEGFINEEKKSVAPDVGSELDKIFFGGFMSIEPQTKKTLTVEYLLPERISNQIKNNLYTLFVQKQLGTLNNSLTVDLNFDKTEGEKHFFQETDLSVNREFEFK